MYSILGWTKYKSIAWIFLFFCILYFINVTPNTYASDVLQSDDKKSKIQIKGSAKVSYEKDTVNTSIKLDINDWKMSFWNRLKDSKKANTSKYLFPTFGGGLSHRYITLGSIYLYGDAKIFEDMSNIYAWSLRFFQKFYWGISSPSASVPLGIRVSYKYFDVWAKISDVTKKEKLIYGTGLRLGYDFKFYEPQFMYQYTARSLDTYVPNADSWYVDDSMALTLHSFALVQKMRIKWFLMRAVLRVSVPDTAAVALHGSLFFDIKFSFLEIQSHVQMAHNYFVTEKLTYQKKAWTHSTQLVVPYIKTRVNTGIFRARYMLWMKNPLADYDFISPAKENTDNLLQDRYTLFWKHIFLSDKKIKHQNSVEYGFDSFYKRHRIFTAYTIFFASWRVDTKLNIQWYYKKEISKTIYLSSSDMYISTRVQRDITQHNITVFISVKLMLQNYKKTTEKYTVFKELIVNPGFKTQLKTSGTYVYLNVSFPYVYTIKKGISSTIKFTFTYKW